MLRQGMGILKPVVYAGRMVRSFSRIARLKVSDESVTVIGNRCGLGGYLLTVASARGLAHDLKLKNGVNILWNTRGYTGHYLFTDLFDITASDVLVLFEDNALTLPLHGGWFNLDESRADADFKYHQRLARAIGYRKFGQRLVFLRGKQLVIEEQEGIDWASSKPLIYADGLFYANPRIDFIRPKPHIIGWIERMKSWFGERTIGVHIRTTSADDSGTGLTEGRSPEEGVIGRMKEEMEKDSRVKFFLSTDNLLSKSRLTHLFPDNTFTQNVSFERHRTGSEGAVVDMYTLSQTEKILASIPSRFSQAAAMLGGIEREVIQT